MDVFSRVEVPMEEMQKERHPFRFLTKLLVFAGIVFGVGRVLMSKKEEYYGLTESEARAKFETKLGPRIGDDKAAEVADQVIPRLKDKGMIKADPIDDAAEKVVEAAEEMVAEAADETEEVVKS
jgi:hypothetical protein